MIDGDDVEGAWFVASLAEGPGCLFTSIAIAIVVTFAYCVNKDECESKHCPSGGRPKLMEHECLCVEQAR